MKIVSLLCGCLRALYVIIMAWPWHRFAGLSSVFQWLWCRFCLVRRFVTAGLRIVAGYVLVAIGWSDDPGVGRRCDPGGRREFEISDNEEDLERSCPVQVEGSKSEDQLNAVVQERAAGCNTEPAVPVQEQYHSPDFESREVPRVSRSEDDGDDEFDSERYRVQTTDELYCTYDSTWETEQSHRVKGNKRRAASRSLSFNRFENAARDMQNYRHGRHRDQTRLRRWNRSGLGDMPNLEFYLGLRTSVPDGLYIHNFHNEWCGEYDALEYVHTYIQWLFPLEEPGMNAEAMPLTKEEVMAFCQNETAKENLLKSYKLMLDFYGIELCNEETGEVRRAPNWKDRFLNLNTYSHNNLRITRILKCQGILGYPHYQAPLVRFFLEETLVNGELPSVKNSVLNYFIFAVLDKNKRRSLIKFAYMNYEHKNEFVWCPKNIQMLWSEHQTY